MRFKNWYCLILLLSVMYTITYAQEVGSLLWEDNFNDDDQLAQYDIGWLYYGEADGLTGSLVEQRDGALYLEQGSYTLIGVSFAQTNGVPGIERDENGALTDETNESIRLNDWSSPHTETTFKLNFKKVTSSWFLAATRVPTTDVDPDPTVSPAYLVYISPLEGKVGLAKVDDTQYAMLDPNSYQWLADLTNYPFELDVAYWVKYYIWDGVFNVKVWEGDASDEPAEWLIETVDPEPRTNGNWSLWGLLNSDPAGKDVMIIDDITVKEVDDGSGVAVQSADTPASFALLQNYPNPFNPTTEITYAVKESGVVTLDVFNQNGQLVKQLINGEHQTGFYRVLWNGLDAAGVAQPSGLYYVRLSGEGVSKTIKMVLMK